MFTERIGSAVIYCAVALFVFGCFFPAFAYAEVIRSFDAGIEVASDGTFSVTETIEYDFKDENRHGIYRTIPLAPPQESETWYLTRFMEVFTQSVEMDGEPTPYVPERGGGELTIRIGDPDQTITGVHTYTIVYEVLGGLSYYEDGTTDLYWNVTGHEWNVPIEVASARVYAPAESIGEHASCYRGVYGATDSCDSATSTDATTFTARNLASGEGLTVAQELEGVERLVLERPSLLMPWLLVGLVWLIGLAVFVFRFVTAHRSGRTIIAQYEPYNALKPMYAGLLMDGRIDAHDITASIVYLAEQGFFRIKRTDRKVLWLFNAEDYEVTLRRPYSELETAFQREIFTLLFDSSASVGDTVALSELRGDTSKQKENHKTIERLRAAARADLVEQGYYERTHRRLLAIGGSTAVTLVLLVILSIFVGASAVSVIVPAIGILLGTIGALAFAWRRRTQKGYEARDHLRGFKEFLSVTDKERFKFHNAPAKSPEQFMQYLPYAIAFGVEKEWAEAFSGITIPQPEWYDGGSAGAFSAVHLANSLDAFGTTFTQSSGTSPASSGGGSAGGGAGGGGGGSW